MNRIESPARAAGCAAARGSAPGSSRRAPWSARRRSAAVARAASAIAIITRWRMPPDISCGKASSIASARGISTRRNRASVSRRASPAGMPRRFDQNLGDLASDAHDRVQRGHRLLEDHREIASASPAPAPRTRPPRDPRRRARMRPAVRRTARGSSPMMLSASMLLPQPELADHPERLARLDAEPHVGQDVRAAKRARRSAPRSRAGAMLRPSCADRARRAGRRRAG